MSSPQGNVRAPCGQGGLERPYTVGGGGIPPPFLPFSSVFALDTVGGGVPQSNPLQTPPPSPPSNISRHAGTVRRASPQVVHRTARAGPLVSLYWSTARGTGDREASTERPSPPFKPSIIFKGGRLQCSVAPPFVYHWGPVCDPPFPLPARHGNFELCRWDCSQWSCCCQMTTLCAQNAMHGPWRGRGGGGSIRRRRWGTPMEGRGGGGTWC